METAGEQHPVAVAEAKDTSQSDGKSAGDLFEALIDRIADRVVGKLEEQRKIDLIAGAVIQRIRLGAHYQEAPTPLAPLSRDAGPRECGAEGGKATKEPDRANSGT